MDSLGQFLKQQRECKGYSLEDAQEETKIQIKYLKALEQENFDILPGEVFTKGFIRSYADYLGLDPQEAMNKYYALKGTKQEEEIESNEPVKVKVSGSKENQDKNQKEGEPASKPKVSPVLTFLAIGVIVLGILIYNFYNNIPDEQTPPPQGVEQTEDIPSQEPAPQPEPQRPAELPAPVYVKTTSTKNCWTQVRIDGKLVFEGVLTPDTVREWQGQERIDFRFGNAGGVNLEYNGQDLGRVGADGEVVNKTFTPN